MDLEIEFEIGWFDSRNAKIAKIHEFGTNKIPIRSHLYKVFQSAEFMNYIKTDAVMGLLASDLQKGSEQIGKLFVDYYRNYVLANKIKPPLKNETIYRKQLKGSKYASTPLIDTAEMLNSIQVKVQIS